MSGVQPMVSRTESYGSAFRARHGVALRERGLWKCTGWRNAAATGRPRSNAGEKRSWAEPSSAAESSAGYPLDSAIRLESAISFPDESA